MTPAEADLKLAQMKTEIISEDERRSNCSDGRGGYYGCYARLDNLQHLWLRLRRHY